MKTMDFIENIKKQNSNYNNPEQASNQANSINALSTDIYTDRTRFVYELLQNADDASVSSDNLEIHFRFNKGLLTVSHKGEAFNEVDIESISSVGDGNKQKDGNKTGFKGIGFKSVFSHSNKVIIQSGKYCFGFEKEFWDDYWETSWGNKEEWINKRNTKSKNSFIKMPWQIIPIKKKLSKRWNELLTDFNVSTLIFHPTELSLIQEVNALFSNSNILLFLRSKNVKIVLQGAKTKVIEKTHQNEDIVTISRNGKVLSNWLTKSFIFDVPEHISTALQSDRKIPEKLKKASRTELSYAIPVRDGQLVTLELKKRLLFTYLPTTVNYNFPFLLNGNFSTDAGRQHFHEDTIWNQWLFEQIPRFLLEWLASFSNTLLGMEILKLIPPKFSETGKLEKSFNKGLAHAIEHIPFLPSKNDMLIKCKEAIFDSYDWSNIIGEKNLLEFINQEKQTNYNTNSFIKDLKPIEKLRGLGVFVPDFNLIEQFFTPTNVHNFIEEYEEDNVTLITMFFEQSKKLELEDADKWQIILENMQFILDSNIEFRSPKELFFPNSKFSTNLNAEINIINPELHKELIQIEGLDTWLRKLGIKEVVDVSYVEKVLIPESSNLVTPENAVEYGRYLFGLYKDGKLSDEIFLALKSFPLLTIKGQVRPANQLFISQYFRPEIDFESVLEEDIFCSKDYIIEHQYLLNEWKSFFLKLGVKEKFIFEKIRDDREALTSKYSCKESFFDDKIYAPYTFRYDKYQINRISFIEKTINNHVFAKLFWSHIFESSEISPSSFQEATLGFWGYAHYSGQKTGKLLESYNEWILKNYNIIPIIISEKCTKSENVYVNTPQIIELVGKHKPIFDYDKPISSEWVAFLGLKTQLTSEDLLKTIISIYEENREENRVSNENQTYLLKIYEELATKTIHEADKQKLKPIINNQNFKLPSVDGQFYFPKELYLINVNDFITTPEYSNIIKASINPPDAIIALFKWLGVNIIENKSTEISNDAIIIDSVKNKLTQLIPLLNLLCLKNRAKNWSDGVSFFNKKIKTLQFNKVTTIELIVHYGDKSIRQQRKVLFNKSETKLYYKGNWENPIVLDFIFNELQGYLDLKKSDKSIVKTLFQVSYADGLDYLIDLGFDKDLIPDNTIVLPEPNPTTPRTSEFSKGREEIGKLGELFTYKKLKLIYERKYNQKAEDTTDGFIIDDLIRVIWKNIAGEQKINYDFLIKEGDKTIYLDSKATRYGKQYHTEFELTGPEFKLMEDSEYYYIARVFDVNEKFEGTSIIFLRISMANLVYQELAII